MKLNELSPAGGSRTARKRKGRGVASGLGTTAGRGTKGQNSRSGGGTRLGYEGGQMPIQRRLPKRGFTNIFKKEFAVINVRDLGEFASGTTVDRAALIESGLIKKANQRPIKLLGSGDIDVSLTVRVNRTSKTAAEKIIAAGGQIEVV